MWVTLHLSKKSPCTLVSYLPKLSPEEKWALVQTFLGKQLWAHKKKGVYSVFQKISLNQQIYGVALGLPGIWRGQQLVQEI